MAITVERLEAQVDADAAGAIDELLTFEAALDAVARDRTATVNVDMDNGAAQAQAAFGQVLDAIDDLAGATADAFGGVQDVLDAMGAGAGNAAAGFDTLNAAGGGASTVINNINGGMGNMIIQVLTLLPSLTMMGVMLAGLYSAATIAVGALHMLAAAAAGVYAALFPLIGLLGAIPVGLGAIGGGLGTVLMGFSGVQNAMSAMDQQHGGGR